MDPVSQAVLGGVAGQQVANKREKLAALVTSALAGMVADLDVLISSDSDPLLFLEYHRHFTHALIFIPIGALICALAFRYAFSRWVGVSSLSFNRLYLFCFAGYATHALLDACTTYGTQLFWPFSDMRVAWNTVSVVDPLFTLPLLALLIMSVIKGSRLWATSSLIYVFLYQGLGVWQQGRALDVAEEVLQQRGHTATSLGVKPSFANILLWKSVYEFEGRYYIDAVRVGLSTQVYQGVSVDKLNLGRHFSWLPKESQQAKDVERFRWFSNQYLALDPQNPNRIIDVRYSMVPNQVTGMWGIELDQEKAIDEHVVWSTNRPAGEKLKQSTNQFWSMLMGR